MTAVTVDLIIESETDGIDAVVSDWVKRQEFFHEYVNPTGYALVFGSRRIPERVQNGDYHSGFTFVNLWGPRSVGFVGNFDFLVDELFKLLESRFSMSVIDHELNPTSLPLYEDLSVRLLPGAGVFDADLVSVWTGVLEWDELAVQDPDLPGRWFLGHSRKRSELAMADWKASGTTTRATVVTLRDDKVEVVGPLDRQVAHFLNFLKEHHPLAHATSLDGVTLPWPVMDKRKNVSYLNVLLEPE